MATFPSAAKIWIASKIHVPTQNLASLFKQIFIIIIIMTGEPQYLETFRAGADPGIILSVLVAELVGRLGGDGFWERDYGWGVRVRRHYGGARGRSSVRYGTRLGDLKENWFLLFSN